MSNKYSDTENSTPVLSALLLEGLFADTIGQIKMSLDCCHPDVRVQTGMSVSKNVVVTHSLSREVAGLAVDVTKNHSLASLNHKHRYFVKRLRTFHTDISSFEVSEHKGDSMKLFLRLLIDWLSDSHLIMMEDTPKKIRQYLSGKGGYDHKAKEHSLDILGSDSGSSDEGGAGGIDAFSATVIEGGSRGDERGASSGDTGGVRVGGLHLLSGETAWGDGEDDPSLEGEGGLEEGRPRGSGGDSGESPDDDPAESGDGDS